MSDHTLVLRKSLSENVISLLWLVTSVIWIVFTMNGQVILHLCWWGVFFLHGFKLGLDYLKPQLAFSDGVLQVAVFRSLWRRECLPILDIITIKESTRLTGGVTQKIGLPTFIFSLSDGREIEFFPATDSSVKLTQVRSFLNQIPGLPSIEIVQAAGQSQVI